MEPSFETVTDALAFLLTQEERRAQDPIAHARAKELLGQVEGLRKELREREREWERRAELNPSPDGAGIVDEKEAPAVPETNVAGPTAQES